LHQKRWERKLHEGAFSSPQRRRFYQAIGHYFLEKDWLRFYSLELNGTFVAHQFCFEYDRKVFLLQEGFDPDLQEKSLGIDLRGYVFKDLIARGVKEYDFLGGINRHKISW